MHHAEDNKQWESAHNSDRFGVWLAQKKQIPGVPVIVITGVILEAMYLGLWKIFFISGHEKVLTKYGAQLSNNN